MTPLTRAALWAAAALFALTACDDDPAAGSRPADAAAAPDAGGAGGAGGVGGGGTARAPLTRAPGRMTVEQLARSIPIVTDGLSWTEDFGQGETDMLEILAPTLGAPDYIRVTEENLEPTLIVAKFLSDASHRICTRWITRDRALPAADRSLVTHGGDWDSLAPEDVTTNLRRLNLRFFARHLSEADDPALEAQRALFFDAAQTAPAGREASDGWLAICIALMTEPDFILY